MKQMRRLNLGRLVRKVAVSLELLFADSHELLCPFVTEPVELAMVPDKVGWWSRFYEVKIDQ